MSKVAEYTAHSMGANALTAVQLSEGVLRVFSGGDDQALSCGTINLNQVRAYLNQIKALLFSAFMCFTCRRVRAVTQL